MPIRQKSKKRQGEKSADRCHMVSTRKHTHKLHRNMCPTYDRYSSRAYADTDKHLGPNTHMRPGYMSERCVRNIIAICTVNTMGSMWGRCAFYLRSRWGRGGIDGEVICGSVWGQSGVDLRPHRGSSPFLSISTTPSSDFNLGLNCKPHSTPSQHQLPGIIATP